MEEALQIAKERRKAKSKRTGKDTPYRMQSSRV